jgi:hypothetical protein
MFSHEWKTPWRIIQAFNGVRSQALRDEKACAHEPGFDLMEDIPGLEYAAVNAIKYSVTSRKMPEA